MNFEIPPRDYGNKWKLLEPLKKAELINHFVDQIELNQEKFQSIQWEEMSKPPSLALGELKSAVRFGRFVANLLSEPLTYEVESITPGKRMLVSRVPYGTMLAITSFNTPLPNYMWKVAPALAAGNQVKLKPSPHTQKSAEYFVDLWRLSNPDFANVLEFIVCSNEETLEMLDNVDGVSFTGSTAVGRLILQKASERNLPVIAELGGSNPFLVMKSADVCEAARAAVISSFSNGGQRCAAGTRFYVHFEVYDSFISAFDRFTREWVAEPMDSSSFAPLCPPERSSDFWADIEKLQSLATNVTRFEIPAWASGVAGSVPPFIFEFDFIPELYSELFAPVALVQKVKSFDEAISLANTSEYGLTAAVWSTSDEECRVAAQEIKAGLLNFNGPTVGAEPTVPFGGFGASGNGTRETGRECILQYSTSRVVTWV